jgi:hypothetical protein
LYTLLNIYAGHFHIFLCRENAKDFAFYFIEQEEDIKGTTPPTSPTSSGIQCEAVYAGETHHQHPVAATSTPVATKVAPSRGERL